ncbi:hypothetical protein Y032_0002g616 [Ancylostoma ceylanicum]|uniref:Uncharacterized protein n=1 Tax=Ancylostoma ceylanicum TaxID=53326 RepID=A0A016VZX1_9BILA|nr:hypothetical protein Y032_0002g616 [Ancylostoma ceylanicum]
MIKSAIVLAIAAMLTAAGPSSVKDCLDLNDVDGFPATDDLVQCAKRGKSAADISTCVLKVFKRVPDSKNNNLSDVIEAALCISYL